MSEILAKLGRVARDPTRIVRRIRRAVTPDSRSILLSQMPKNAICAEIGVWQGDFSARILSSTKPKELHLVDPWIFAPNYPARLYGGTFAKNQADMDAICDSVAKRFSDDPRVKIHRTPSLDFLAKAPILDWIYIDGDHSTDAVLADLHAAWRAVHPGGFIVGDDFFWADADGSLPIKLALQEFGQDFKLIGSQFVIQR